MAISMMNMSAYLASPKLIFLAHCLVSGGIFQDYSNTRVFEASMPEKLSVEAIDHHHRTAKYCSFDTGAS